MNLQVSRWVTLILVRTSSYFAFVAARPAIRAPQRKLSINVRTWRTMVSRIGPYPWSSGTSSHELALPRLCGARRQCAADCEDVRGPRHVRGIDGRRPTVGNRDPVLSQAGQPPGPTTRPVGSTPRNVARAARPRSAASLLKYAVATRLLAAPCSHTKTTAGEAPGCRSLIEPGEEREREHGNCRGHWRLLGLAECSRNGNNVTIL